MKKKVFGILLASVMACSLDLRAMAPAGADLDILKGIPK